MKSPLVSIVIPSRNSASTIEACLRSIRSQTYTPIELFVVDNHSVDATRTIAKKFTRLVITAGPERAAQVNAGAQMAHGKYIYRVDSDFILEPNVVRECVSLCEREKLDGIAVHNTSAFGLGFWAEVRRLERNSYTDDDLIVAVRFFSKKSWKAIGGFDEKLFGPEDYDFHNRFVASGFRWGRIHSQELHLGEPRSLGDVWRKHFFYGKQMYHYVKKHPKRGRQQISPFRVSFIRHWQSFAEHPVLFAGLVVYLAVKFTSGGLGYLSEWSSHI